MDWVQTLILAIAGLISGTLASLVAPWINWGIERKREQLNAKRLLLQDVRDKPNLLEHNKRAFRESIEYSRIRPYLTRKLIDEIETNDITMIVEDEKIKGMLDFRRMVLKEITALEKKWKLI